MSQQPPLLRLYRTTAAGKAHWAPLEAQTYNARGAAMRVAMTPRDWAKQQICMQLEPVDRLGVAAMFVRRIAQDIARETIVAPDDQLALQASHTAELFRELLAEGFIEVAADATEADIVFELEVFTQFYGKPREEDLRIEGAIHSLGQNTGDTPLDPLEPGGTMDGSEPAAGQP